MHELTLDGVEAALLQAGFALAPDLKPQLADLLSHGTHELEEFATDVGPRGGRDPDDMAKDSMSQLLQAMIEDAEQRGSKLVDPAALNNALRGLCPLPPWC